MGFQQPTYPTGFATPVPPPPPGHYAPTGVVAVNPNLGTYPAPTYCPSCRAYVSSLLLHFDLIFYFCTLIRLRLVWTTKSRCWLGCCVWCWFWAASFSAVVSSLSVSIRPKQPCTPVPTVELTSLVAPLSEPQNSSLSNSIYPSPFSSSLIFFTCPQT